jgi:hypothetical protein
MPAEVYTKDDLERFRDLLNKASSTDFDGHTEFHRLTNEQKLMWLSQCAQFCSDIPRE